jgi:hypothetical protein
VTKGPSAQPWWLLPPGRLHPLWWLAAGVALLGLDWVLGLDTLFPTLYVIPVVVAAWYSGPAPATGLAIGLPIAHIAFLIARATPAQPLAAGIAMTTARAAIIFVMALWFARFAEHERELQHRLQTLEGLLPICMFCKKIRNENGEWERLEAFISKRSQAQFSHGFCPSCGQTHYADFVDEEAFGRAVSSGRRRPSSRAPRS